MKAAIISILLILICLDVFSQNITNTLGSSGLFTIKDVSNNYLTLSQSTGQVNILKTLRLENTTSSSLGIIFKGADRFLHNYQATGTNGYNTFLGINAGNFTMSGSGPQASYNTGIGFSLYSLTTGYENTAMGFNSLGSNTTGYFNTALGVQSLYTNTTGYENTALGLNSLYNNTTGYENTALGLNSLFSNTTGYENTALGLNSLYNNTSGIQNTAVGFNSLFSNTTGFNNAALGIISLYSNTTGYANSAFGFHSLNTNTIGAGNVAFGYLAGDGITTGDNNIAIGYWAQVPSGSSDNQVRIGNSATTYAGIQVAWTITSDRRWKQNIMPTKLGLGFISKLNPVSYTRVNDENKKTEYGFIGQELDSLLKEYKVENPGMITVTDEGKYELRYNDLLTPMVKAIQELKAENDELKIEMESLKMVNEKIVQLEQILMELKNKDNDFQKVKSVEK